MPSVKKMIKNQLSSLNVENRQVFRESSKGLVVFNFGKSYENRESTIIAVLQN